MTTTTPFNTVDALDFRSLNLLFVGDLMLDQYWQGATGRISPEAPVPVVHVNSQQARPGGAANAALNAKTLDANVSLAGIFGQDEPGNTLTHLIDEAHINNLSIRSDRDQTITKLRILSQNQQMIRADFEAPFSDCSIQELTKQVVDNLAQHDLLVLSDYNKGALSECQMLIQQAKKIGKPVIVDPKGNDFSKYKGATLLTPNLSEFEAVVGPCSDSADILEKAQGMINTLSLEALLITLSENGMLLIDANGEHHHFNALAKEVYDVTGAGDTVIATLACAMAKGSSLKEAAFLANSAASIVVGKLGASQISCLDLKSALSNHRPVTPIFSDIDALRDVLAFEKQLGKRIIFTNGCFDILHKGHTAYLREAKALGDRLVVAINDDESIKRLKGDKRPVNALEDRMSLLASLSSVDYVIPFSGDTPTDLIKLLEPNVLAKGGDYGIEEVVGADIVQSYGGDVKVLSLQQGRSTTTIIDTIIRSHGDS